MGGYQTAGSVLLVDDDERQLRAWTRLLRDTDWQTGTVTDIRDAEVLIKRQGWDVLLVDYFMPNGPGTNLLPVIESLSPRPGVAVISSHVDAEMAFALRDSFAYLLPKPLGLHLLLSLLPFLKNKVVPTDWIASFCNSLSPKEREVLRVGGEGLTVRETARKMECSESAVRTYWKRIARKTNRRDRHDVIMALMKHRAGLQLSD